MSMNRVNGTTKKMKRIILGMLMVLTMFTIVPIMEPITISAYTFPTTLTLNHTDKVLVLGDKVQLIPNADDTTRTRWMSDNPAVATVSDLGEVTAKGLGTTIIRVAFGGMMAECKITVKLADITGASVKRSSDTALKVSWVKVPSANGYVVYRSTKADSGFKSVKTITKGTTVSFTNTKLKTGTTYYYKVRAYKTVSGKKVYGEYTAVLPGAALKTPTAAVKSTGYNSLAVSWKKITGATGYEIVRSDTKTGVYTVVGTTTGNASVKFEQTVTFNKTYYYKVRAYKEILGVKFYGAYSGIKSAKSVLAKPAITVKSSTTGVTIAWTAITGAQEYEIQRATSEKGKYTTLTTVSGTSYVDTTAVSGKTYYYKVRAGRTDGGTKVYSGFSGVKNLVYVGMPSSFVATKAGTEVSLSWNKVAGATGYVIERSENGGSYKTIATITKVGTIVYTDKKATAGQTYQYRIRAYKTVGKAKKYSEYAISLAINMS